MFKNRLICLSLLAFTISVPGYSGNHISHSSFTIKRFGTKVIPLALNDNSDILAQCLRKKNDNIYIVSKDRYFPTVIPSSDICDLNNADHILAETKDHSKAFIWIRGHSYPLHLPPGFMIQFPCINNKNEVLVENEHGDTGIYKNGTVKILFSGMRDYHIHSIFMNDFHQVVGIIQGPFNNSLKGKSHKAFASRGFMWSQGKFHYLKSPKSGFCYVTGINDEEEIVGEV